MMSRYFQPFALPGVRTSFISTCVNDPLKAYGSVILTSGLCGAETSRLLTHLFGSVVSPLIVSMDIVVEAQQIFNLP